MLQNKRNASFSFMCLIWMRKTFFDPKGMFFSQSLQKCFKTPEKLSLAVCVSFSCEKPFFDLKGMFLVNFPKSGSKHQKSLVYCMWLILMRETLF